MTAFDHATAGAPAPSTPFDPSVSTMNAQSDGSSRVAVRVAPRVYLPPVAFAPTVVVAPARDRQVWRDRQELEVGDEWADFTMNVDRRGTQLLLEVQEGPARLSFAEVVFDNGDTQVVDFTDGVHPPGLYGLLDFADGRKVDHVRLVARATDDEATIAVRLIA